MWRSYTMTKSNDWITVTWSSECHKEEYLIVIETGTSRDVFELQVSTALSPIELNTAFKKRLLQVCELKLGALYEIEPDVFFCP